MVIMQYITELEGLSETKAKQVFDIVAQKIMEKGEFADQPDGIEGLKILTQQKSFLRKSLADFIASLPKAKVGVWVLKGWEKAIPRDCDEYVVLNKYFEKLKTDGNPIVQTTLKAIWR